MLIFDMTTLAHASIIAGMIVFGIALLVGACECFAEGIQLLPYNNK